MEKNKRQPLYEFSILVKPKALGFRICADNLYIWGYSPEEAKAIADSFTSHYLLDGAYNDDSVQRPADDEGWYEFFDGSIRVCRTRLEETPLAESGSGKHKIPGDQRLPVGQGGPRRLGDHQRNLQDVRGSV